MVPPTVAMISGTSIADLVQLGDLVRDGFAQLAVAGGMRIERVAGLHRLVGGARK